LPGMSQQQQRSSKRVSVGPSAGRQAGGKATTSGGRLSMSVGSGGGGKPNPKLNYKQTCSLKEGHGQSVYALQFNNSSGSEPCLFATAGACYVTVYACLPDGVIELLQAYADPAGDEEEFCCLAWSLDPITRQQVILTAGRRGVIRVICPSMAACLKSLVGHGNSVNHLKVSPRNPALLFSFSKDYTARAWNLATGHQVAIFGGCDGHRSEVLHGDVNLDCSLLLSCGMDHSVRLWRLDRPEFERAARLSETWSDEDEKRRFPTWMQHHPDFVTREVHGNYIDCAAWFGNCILSKSCESCVVLWKPGSLKSADCGPLRHTDNAMSILYQFEVKNCDIWFIKFDLHLPTKRLALGNSIGKVQLFDLDAPDIFDMRPATLNVTKGQGAVRQTCFSRDGSTLLCVCDFGLVVRFDLDKQSAAAAATAAAK
ncbi:hypothetical protein BOX15_Mlig028922g1, partial [Macrostomum lignano]